MAAHDSFEQKPFRHVPEEPVYAAIHLLQLADSREIGHSAHWGRQGKDWIQRMLRGGLEVKVNEI